MHASQATYDVLVVGAGPAGLTTAAALARAGVRTLVVERHAGTSIFPKATGIRPRTMEILRGWGLEDRVRERAQDVRLTLAVSETLAGPTVAEDSLGVPPPEVLRRHSPTTWAICPQDAFEPVLLDHVRAHGGEVRFRTTLAGFALDGDGVTARLRRPGSRTADTVRARFLVGADGAGSTVRRGLGIGVEQLGTEGQQLTVLFHADLSPVLGDRRHVLHWVTAPGTEGLFVPSGEGRWVYARDRDAEPAGSPVAWTPQRCAAAIRAAAGVPDLDLEVRRLFTWSFGAAVATAQRAGRGFLVGDAAHLTTPRGATGMNTGIADAHNLGWKLAWVVRGWAGDALLDSYATERRPVGRHNALASLDPSGSHGLGHDFGVVYRSDVVVPDGTADLVQDDGVPDARPGARAPHAEVRVGGRWRSTLDLFDGRLTVLTGPDGGAWRAAGAELADTGLPVATVTAGREITAHDDPFAERYRLGRSGAVLVRPDGHVAWRRAQAVDDCRGDLSAAVATALGRGAAPAAPRLAG